MITSDLRYEIREALCRRGQQARDVVDKVRGVGGLLDNPPYKKSDYRISEDLPELHRRLPGIADFTIVPIPLY
jgi:hypothetical protein